MLVVLALTYWLLISSQGSVNVNTTLLFESLTYNDTLLLERWLFEQQALNTISATVLGMSSNTGTLF